MKQNGEVQPIRESLKTRITRALPVEHRRGVAVATLVGALVLVAGGVAIAATVDNPTSDVAVGHQPEIVNAPSALPSGGSNDPLTASPQSPTPSTLLPGGNVFTSTTQGPTSPTTANGNRASTTSTVVSSRGGAAGNPASSPTTTAPPRSTPASTPAASPTTTAPTTTVVRFDRIFSIAALDGSNGFLPGDPRVAIDVDTNDNGGFISKISVNWQAGLTPETRNYDLADCTVGSNGRPTSNRSERFTHNYADPGTYNVVVAVTSTDCNGDNSRTNYQMVSLTASGVVSQGDQQARR